jgi:hypothetical protein
MIFFLVLIVLGTVAVVVPIVYNLRQQLTPEQVAAARARWQANGTRDYVLEYQVRVDSDPRPDEYRVKVRDGKPISAICNGQPMLLDDGAGLLLGPGVKMLPAEDCLQQTVDGMFDEIERRLHQGTRADGKRNYATASFDSRDGHPHRFIYRVAGTKERLEWIIKLIRLDPETGEPVRGR